MTPETQKEYLTSAEVASGLRMSIQNVRILAKKHKIARPITGAHYQYSFSDLTILLNNEEEVRKRFPQLLET
jgi:hypothetical protein